MKGIIYTVITGAYDLVESPERVDGWHYVLVVDQITPIRPFVLEEFDTIIRLVVFEVEAPMVQRWWKIFGYLYIPAIIGNLQRVPIIYHDGKLHTKADPTPLADLLTAETELVIRKHPSRSCIYQEAEACMQLNKIEEWQIRHQLPKYRNEWLVPGNAGLVDTSVLVRWAPTTFQYTRAFYQKWWQELRTYPHHRDQLSFNAVLWAHPMRIRYFTEYNHVFHKQNHR